MLVRGLGTQSNRGIVEVGTVLRLDGVIDL